MNAINFYNGTCIVLAGPGSGKTTVITYRTKMLIEKHGVNPANILVITFTKSSAIEMQERFLSITEKKNYPVTFGTFHAIYFKILRYAYNYSAQNIIREENKYGIIREIIESMDLEIDDEADFISGILNEISLVKGEMISLEHYYSKNCGENIFKEIYKRYNDKLLRSNLIDFDDMLVMCYELLSQRPDILKIWQNKYRYILIDEFQDINRVQYEIIKLLAKPEKNLFIVGDDDQSIYRFRGAKPEIMLNFENDYKNVETIYLDVNYRSTENIVNAAESLIKHNESRYKKNIKATQGKGSTVSIKEYKNNIEECKAIIEIISDHIKSGGEYEDIAVIFRTNTNPRVLVEKLMEYNIPFKVKDAVPNIYEHFIAKNILSYIKISLGGNDRSDFLQIINRPKRYINRQVFRSSTVILEDIYEAYKDKDYVVERLTKLEYDLTMISKMSPYAAINYIRHAVGYEEYLKEYSDYRRINPEELYEILDELTVGAKSFSTYDEWFVHIQEYGNELKKQSKERMMKKNCVELSTMHSAKGLEYDKVIILDANEGITPHKKSLIKADIEEERRMFYVAMTRAKKELYIFHCKERYGKELGVSRFIEEILESDSSIKIGAIVTHSKYGIGCVKVVNNDKILVYFNDLEREILFDRKTVLSKGILQIYGKKH